MNGLVREIVIPCCWCFTLPESKACSITVIALPGVVLHRHPLNLSTRIMRGSI